MKKSMHGHKTLLIFILIGISLCFDYVYAHASSDTKKKTLHDGTYIGRSFKFPWSMKIAVTIDNNKIEEISMLRHPAPKKYREMMDVIIAKIIKKQSVDVDAISGATISCNSLKKAVTNALDKSYINEQK